MLKSIVSCTGINKINSSKLFDGAQSLELRSVYYPHTQGVDLNVSVNWVIQNLKCTYASVKVLKIKKISQVNGLISLCTRICNYTKLNLVLQIVLLSNQLFFGGGGVGYKLIWNIDLHIKLHKFWNSDTHLQSVSSHLYCKLSTPKSLCQELLDIEVLITCTCISTCHVFISSPHFIITLYP